MEPNKSHKRAFSTSHGHFEFARMPLRLKNALVTIQRLMVLTGLQGEEVFVYLDDIVLCEGHSGNTR